MADGILKQSVGKLRAMRPAQIRREALRPFHLELIGAEEADQARLGRVFVPGHLRGPERARALEHLDAHPDAHPDRRPARPRLRVRTPAALDLEATSAVAPAVVVDPLDPEPGLLALLTAHPTHRLALARVFPVLRPPLAREMIRAVAARNAAIAAVSALPEVIPNPLGVLLAIGEMGSDTVLITANQIELAFRLAALRGDDVGWRAQSRALAAVIGAGLGWRTLARELVGWIPAGIGVAAKASVAYTGTMAVGEALWRLPHRREGRIWRAVEELSPATRRRLARRRQTA